MTPVGGAGCGARGFGLVSRASGTPRVAVRPNYVGLPSLAGRGPDERGRKPAGSGGPKSPHPAPEARPRARKVAAVERRKAGALPITARATPEGVDTVR